MTDSEAIDLPDTPGSEHRDTSSDPLVSVVVPSYEAERSRVAKLLRSIAEQPYRNLEVVIVDSSRLDFLTRTADDVPWVRHVPSEPRGVSAGCNEALAHATGEIIALIPDDDYVTRERFVRPVEEIERGADIVYGDVYDLDEETGELSYRRAIPMEDPDRQWVHLFRYDGMEGNVPSATVTFRAECVADERFDESLKGGEDYHLWVRLFEAFDPAYVPEPLAVMRQHDESLSSDPDLMYRNRVRAVDLLCDRYDELEPYREERKLLERYDYARHLLLDGRTSEARAIFREVLLRHRYYRSAVMLAVSYLPFGRERTIRLLDRLRTALSNAR
jgi:glycosyltransferase involved in cell wall biosynthesis